MELDGDPGAGVDAGHEVYRGIRGGSSISGRSGRSGESSLAEDGQEGKPGKIDDEHSARGLLDAAVLVKLADVEDGVIPTLWKFVEALRLCGRDCWMSY
jgi:hypothetical protein